MPWIISVISLRTRSCSTDVFLGSAIQGLSFPSRIRSHGVSTVFHRLEIDSCLVLLLLQGLICYLCSGSIPGCKEKGDL